MSRPLERRQRLTAAVLCLGLALALVYVARAGRAGLRAPPGVVYLGAATFAAAGATLLLRWVAFGPGPRRCQASFGGFGFIPPELLCRTAFGIGALLLGVIAWLMLRTLLRRQPQSLNGAA